MRCKLNNDNSINIWKDPWLRNSDKCYVTSPPPIGLEHMTVNSLIDGERKCRRLDNGQQILNNEDLQDIQISAYCETKTGRFLKLSYGGCSFNSMILSEVDCKSF